MGATMVGMATSADKPGGVLPPIAGISDDQYRAIGRIAVQFGFLEMVLSDLCPLFRSPTGGGPSPGEEVKSPGRSWPAAARHSFSVFPFSS